jgi:hypothetical protein
MAVDVAFRKHHKISKAPLNEKNLGVAHSARRLALRAVLEKDLRLVIEIRNKLAHGQWKYPLNNAGTAVETDKYQAINNENLLSLEFKQQMVGHLADAVHDLVVSAQAFERDFESHFKKLYQAQVNVAKRDYQAYAAELVKRRAAARAALKAAP